MSDDLRSASVPAVGADDWVGGPPHASIVVIEYADFECPYCAVMSARLAGAARALAPGLEPGLGPGLGPGLEPGLEPGLGLGLGRVFRHFPVKSAHPRALAAACAAEAAGLQARFWEMHDLLFADQARLEDPHLWDRARTLGLDLERFDADRRGSAVRARVDASFRAGVRAGVVTTPTLFVVHAGAPPALVADDELDRLLG